jgi:hypothetical protein
MKIRQGFVSNSSSSSFVCSCCNDVYTGYDGQYDDTEAYECVNRHELCSECIIKIDDLDIEDNNSIDEKHCPFCTFKVIDEYDVYRFLLKTSKITQKEVYEYYISVFPDRIKEKENVSVLEYTNYVCVKKGILLIDLLKELKTKFATYRAFSDYLKDGSK